MQGDNSGLKLQPVPKVHLRGNLIWFFFLGLTMLDAGQVMIVIGLCIYMTIKSTLAHFLIEWLW